MKQPGEKVSFLRQSGSIPIFKVAFVGVSTLEKSGGCSPRRGNMLRINSGGGEIEIAIPSRKEADRLQRTIDELVSAP